MWAFLFWSRHSTNYSDLPTFVIQGSQHLPLSSPLGLGSVVTSSGRWSLLPESPAAACRWLCWDAHVT